MEKDFKTLCRAAYSHVVGVHGANSALCGCHDFGGFYVFDFIDRDEGFPIGGAFNFKVDKMTGEVSGADAGTAPPFWYSDRYDSVPTVEIPAEYYANPDEVLEAMLSAYDEVRHG